MVLPGDPTAGGLVVVEPGEGAGVLHGVDVVFPVLHGPYGEDGTIQGLLEMAGVPYVGSGVLGSAVAMDKEFTKKLLAAEGLPVGPYAVVRAGRVAGRRRTGSGSGCRCSSSRPAAARRSGSAGWTTGPTLPAAIAAARAVDDKVLVEAAVPGREIELAVLEGLDGAPPDVSVPAEILLSDGREWYDFEAKYLDDVSALDIPADLPAGVTARLRELAARAFTALDCAGLARVDFFVGPGGEITVNEVNTMPGFTPISVFPRAWAASGLDYPALLDRLHPHRAGRPRLVRPGRAGGASGRRSPPVDSRATGALASAAGASTSTYTGRSTTTQAVVGPRRSANQLTPLICCTSAVAMNDGGRAHPAAQRHRRLAPGRHVRRGRVDRAGRQVAEVGRQRGDQLLAGPLLRRPTAAAAAATLIGGSAAAVAGALVAGATGSAPEPAVPRGQDGHGEQHERHRHGDERWPAGRPTAGRPAPAPASAGRSPRAPADPSSRDARPGRSACG